MTITNVKIRMIEGETRLKAVASITIDDEFVVHELRIIEGKDGMFVAMPSRTINDGSHKDIAHPINTETRRRIEARVLEEYHKVLG